MGVVCDATSCQRPWRFTKTSIQRRCPLVSYDFVINDKVHHSGVAKLMGSGRSCPLPGRSIFTVDSQQRCREQGELMPGDCAGPLKKEKLMVFLRRPPEGTVYIVHLRSQSCSSEHSAFARLCPYWNLQRTGSRPITFSSQSAQTSLTEARSRSVLGARAACRIITFSFPARLFRSTPWQ